MPRRSQDLTTASASTGPARATQRPAGLRPPPDLSVAALSVGDDALAVIEWPVVPWSPAAALSPAEREVLGLVLAGLSNPAIARRRGRAQRTVANQVASLFRKLGVGSRLELQALVAAGAPLR